MVGGGDGGERYTSRSTLVVAVTGEASGSTEYYTLRKYSASQWRCVRMW